jgi:membrane protease YdiL (CAAX protease family)
MMDNEESLSRQQEADPGSSLGSSLQPSSSGREWWRGVALLLVVIVLFLSSGGQLRNKPTRQSHESAQLVLNSTIQSRQAYAVRNFPLSRAQKELSRRSAYDSLEKLIQQTSSPTYVRKLAILKRSLHDPTWRETLLQLRQLPRTRSPYALDRELSLWNRVLGYQRLEPSAVPALRNQIRAMRLGWYEHLALENLYLNARMNRQAESAASAANRSLILLSILVIVGLGALLLGVLLNILLLVFLLKRKQQPHLLAGLLSPPAPLTRIQSNTLYNAFLLFLICFAGIRFLIPLLITALPGDLRPQITPVVKALLSILAISVAVGIPLLYLKRMHPRVGLTWADAGFRCQNLRLEIGWGIVGYLIALPLLIAASLLSSWLFRGIDTPLNPVVTEMASSPGLLLVLLIFLQAVILAPVTEEMMFRGIFYQGLLGRMSRTMALVLCSAVFAILHPQLPLGFLGIFTLGMVFNLLFVLRGSLIAPILAHAINNGVVFTMLAIVQGS